MDAAGCAVALAERLGPGAAEEKSACVRDQPAFIKMISRPLHFSNAPQHARHAQVLPAGDLLRRKPAAPGVSCDQAAVAAHPADKTGNRIGIAGCSLFAEQGGGDALNLSGLLQRSLQIILPAPAVVDICCLWIPDVACAFRMYGARPEHLLVGFELVVHRPAALEQVLFQHGHTQRNGLHSPLLDMDNGGEGIFGP